MEKTRIGIVGAGIGGLATAVRLAAAGFRTEVFEKNHTSGGKVGEIRDAGFRFDTGPSLFTLPQLLDELFETAGTPPEMRLKYYQLPEVCRYFFPDGKQLTVPSSPETFAGNAESSIREPSVNVLSYLRRAETLYDLTSGVFLFSPFQKLNKLLVKKNIRVALRLHQLRAFSTLHRYNRQSFLQSNMVQLFDRYATYNGSNPFRAPATLNIISHLEHNLGAWFPEGGMRKIAEALEQEATRLGVTFHFHTPVQEILVSRNTVTGLSTGAGIRPFDHVVSNADIFHTYQKLLPGSRLPRALGKQDISTSAIIFLWGVEGMHLELGMHNILFSDDYKREFDHLNQGDLLYKDPTVYIYISARENPDDAPSGCENWFVMVNAPADKGQYDPLNIKQVRDAVLQKIENRLGRNIQALIRTENINTPDALACQTNAFRGALYGMASNNMFSAFLRHPNFSRKIKNLWFAGGTVHPGGGIPLCLSSAKIVSELLMERILNIASSKSHP